MCGASRSSACELDANGPKVKSVAGNCLGTLLACVWVRLCEIRRFLLSLRGLTTAAASAQRRNFAAR